MLRATAAALRGGGRDPSEYRWLACDIDPVAVGALAVNAHIWGLGPHVLLECADSVAEPDWHVRAAREQAQADREQWMREVAATLLAQTEILRRQYRSL